MTNKGLQKLTKTDDKISFLFGLKRVTREDLTILSEKERRVFEESISQKLSSLKGSESERFIKKIESILVDGTKNELWEYNHRKIIWSISSLMKELGRMPTKTELAAQTELSRQTVHKHLEQYRGNMLYQVEMAQFRILTGKVLEQVFQYALNGDMSAAKLYLQYFEDKAQDSPPGQVIQNQNNFIQINGTMISQEAIQQLNPQQKNIIEGLMRKVIKNQNFTNEG
jgi:hypothetical protein